MKLILATNNPSKLEEFRRILSPLGFEVISQSEAGFDMQVEETGKTFAENAFLKADAIHRATGLPTVADDSGLVVKALKGAPGVYSARYAGEHATDEQNNQKLLNELIYVGVEERQAKFVCSICYIDPNGEAHYTDGICEGRIGFAERGENGFGYDPLFYANGKSFAEMTDAEKDKYSHRGRALRQLAAIVKELNEVKIYTPAKGE